MKQPIFKFGDLVQEINSPVIFTITTISLDKDAYRYSGLNVKFFNESELQLYIPPAPTYSITKQQLAEAYVHAMAGNTFEQFCKHLGVE